MIFTTEIEQMEHFQTLLASDGCVSTTKVCAHLTSSLLILFKVKHKKRVTPLTSSLSQSYLTHLVLLFIFLTHLVFLKLKIQNI